MSDYYEQKLAELEDHLVETEVEFSNCRKRLAESVCKECKCEVNTSVNFALLEKIRVLEEARDSK